MQDRTSRYAKIIVIVFSLLLNAILLIIILCIQDDVHLQPVFIVTMEQEKDKENEKIEESNTYLVDKLISFGSSPVGTTILPQPNSALLSQVANTQVMPTQQQEPLQEELSRMDESTDNNLQETTEAKQEEEETDSCSPDEDNKEQIIEPTTIINEISDIDRFEEQKKEFYNKNEKSKQTSRKTSQNESTQKRKLTLADIAHGYMRHFSQEKEHTAEQQLRSLPSSKQMALQVYSTKIFGLLEQAAKVNQKMLYASQDRIADTILVLTINKDGNLLEAYLTPPLNEKEVRDWLFSFINKVGLFPPIPAHLNQDKLTLSFPLRIDMRQGFGNYSFYYGLCNRY